VRGVAAKAFGVGADRVVKFDSAMAKADLNENDKAAAKKAAKDEKKAAKDKKK
jgi:hypothetical protein